MRACVRACVCVSWKCTSKGTTSRLNYYDSVKNIDFIHVYVCEATHFPTDAMFAQRDRLICVIDRSRCATDGFA